jgi:hypothetical protein
MRRRRLSPQRGRACASIALGVLVAVAASLLLAQTAAAASSAGPPRWTITSVAGPTYFKPSSSGEYLVTATNVGGEPTSGPVTITDTLGTGVEATRVVASTTPEEGIYGDAFTGKPLACTLAAPSSVACEYTGPVDPGDTLTFVVKVTVSAGEGEVVRNSATVSGGGAASASTRGPTSTPTPVTSRPVPFGVASFFAALSTPQAGAHPNFTTSFWTNWAELRNGVPLPAGAPRNVRVELPPGLTGDPLSVPRCNIDYVRRELCDEDTAVGIATTRTQGGNVFTQLVYSITPYPDEPAAFAFTVDRGIGTVRLDTSLVRGTSGEYVVRVSVFDANESEALLSSSVTLWAVPSQHNGPGPDHSTECAKEPCLTFGGPGAQAALGKPFVRNPTSCSGSPALSLSMDSWQQPEVFAAVEPSQLSTPDECGLLSPLFTPVLEVAPDGSTEIAPQTFQASAPAGYEVKLKVPQPELAQVPGTPDLKDASVTLPEGTVPSPSAANGLQACSEHELSQYSLEPAACPAASQIGTVEITTPLLLTPLKGQLFVGEPECAPCGPAQVAEGRMVRLFVQAQGSGVRVKLLGRTLINQANGQLTTVFKSTPQEPFEQLTLHIDGGPTAPLANPATCGTATTTSVLVPWNSSPATPFAAEPSSSFQVGGCGPPRFAPSFTAGTTGTAQAGAYSPLSVVISRNDKDPELGGITVHTPPGLLAAVSHVKQCGEPQAAQGTCPPASDIGTVEVSAGPGPDPFWITEGRAYLTGPYNGAPFGLSIVVPAIAGPFNLGEEHVRAAIFVDPHSATVSVVSDPLPTSRDGIPFQVKTIVVNVNLGNFVFNATSCEAMTIGASITSTHGLGAVVSSPYQAHGCSSLPFEPRLTATVDGQGSKAQGTGFNVSVTSAGIGEAGVRKVFLTIPKLLPARLQPTLQHACTEAAFNANPASCPAESVIGTGTVHTPLLNSSLSGPVYIVSHGGAAFPDVEFVLQGEGVTIILDGKTDIKKGVTYSRFESLPDAPFTSFESSLPAGPHSIFTDNTEIVPNYNVCAQKIEMPTEITAQNGAVIKQNTNVAISGCQPSVKIMQAKRKHNALLVTLETTASGSVLVNGGGLQASSVSLDSGRHQVRVALTQAGRALGSHHRRTIVHARLKAGAGTAAAVKAVRL